MSLTKTEITELVSAAQEIENAMSSAWREALPLPFHVEAEKLELELELEPIVRPVSRPKKHLTWQGATA